jgi:hypothetical protein
MYEGILPPNSVGTSHGAGNGEKVRLESRPLWLKHPPGIFTIYAGLRSRLASFSPKSIRQPYLRSIHLPCGGAVARAHLQMLSLEASRHGTKAPWFPFFNKVGSGREKSARYKVTDCSTAVVEW